MIFGFKKSLRNLVCSFRDTTRSDLSTIKLLKPIRNNMIVINTGRKFIPLKFMKKPSAKTETIKPIDPHALIPPYRDVSFDIRERVIDSN